jgi:hypothetical protein
MATQQTNGNAVTNSSTKNNHGTISSYGSSSGTFTMNRPSTDKSNVGSTVIDGPNTDKANNAGVFAFHNTKPVAIKLTNSLATVSNDFLISGANDTNNFKAINYQLVDNSGVLTDGVRTNQNTSAIRQGKFDIYSGKFDPGYPVVSEDAFLGSDGTSGDKAAKVSRQDQGSLVFIYGSPTPVSQDYDEKTG